MLTMSVVALMIAIGLGLRGADSTTSMTVEATLGATVQRAFTSRDYILLTGGFFVCGLHLFLSPPICLYICPTMPLIRQ